MFEVIFCQLLRWMRNVSSKYTQMIGIVVPKASVNPETSPETLKLKLCNMIQQKLKPTG